jgi:hypothetical protein
VDKAGSSFFNEQFELISACLGAEGLGGRVEPQKPNETFSCGMLGYGGLHSFGGSLQSWL